MVEQRADNAEVGGSSPPIPTIYPGVAKLGKAPDLGSGNFARSNRVTRTKLFPKILGMIS